LAGPLPLTYGPYLNFSDGLIPADDSDVLFWHSGGMPAVVGHQGQVHRAVLMAVPLETLPVATHDEVINQMVGWIGDLGGSSIVVDHRNSEGNEARTYTITIHNTAVAPTNQVTMSNRLPDGLTLIPSSLSGGATYDPNNRTISWQGTMPSDTVRRIIYRAVVNDTLPAGTAVENKVTFAYSNHSIVFDSYATTWLNAPNLNQSTVVVEANKPIAPDRLTMTLWLTNTGLYPTAQITAVLYIPQRISPLTDTVQSLFGTAVYTDSQLIWLGDLAPTQSVTASMAFTRSVSAITEHLQTILSIEDGVTAGIMTHVEALIQPFRSFFPFAAQSP
jgi:uncharacterized repeat protein (TIGR01451 family)